MIRILAVDDEEGILTLIKNVLERDSYFVKTLSSWEGVRSENLQNYQLILLDIMLPGKDGFQICSEIREQVDCPILFLTAKSSEEDIMRGLGLGGDDYITKPFGIGELRARVAAHLRRENREKKHAVMASGISFFLNAKHAVYGEKELPFTKSEYEICEYLALHRGQVFSKEQIYEAVFGYQGEGNYSVITEHVKNIRAKCIKYDLEPIETVWGIGYRWK